MKNITIKSFATKVSIVLLFACCISQLSYGQNLIGRIKAINDKNGTIVAPFTETDVMPKLKKETTKSGQLWFEAPGSLLMKYDNPEGDVTLIHDGKFTTRRAGKVQNFSMKPTKDPTPMQILRNSLLYSFQGDVEKVAKENNAKIEGQESTTRIKFTITRKITPQQGINSIELLYDKVTGALLQMKVIKVNGNYTLYETTKPLIKQIIPKETWTL